MNIAQLVSQVQQVRETRQQGAAIMNPDTPYGRFTSSRMRDMSTHIKYIGAALGGRDAALIDARELTDENEARMRAHLTGLGKKEDVIRNTLSTFRLLRDLAVAEGVEIVVLPKLVKPRRGRVYQKDADGRFRLVAKTGYASNNAPYRHRHDAWSEALKAEFEPIQRFYTDEFADHRNDTILRPSTMALRLARFERAFGIELARGVGPADLGFRKLASKTTLVEHRRFLHGRNGGRDTEGLRGYLDQFRALALDFYEDKPAADEIALYMRQRCKFKAVKDRQGLVERVHADDLHRVLDCLVAEARAYEANLKRKKGRRFPAAMMAAHWHKAAIWGFTLTTLLREQNVVGATTRHVYKKPDGTWAYAFGEDEMKSGHAKADDVVDLWRGEPALALVRLALDKAVETRPHLIERFRADHPGEPEPEAFFLSMDGKAFAPSAARTFFAAASVKYLDPTRRISMHDVRMLIASWLFVREGYEILDVLQHHLGHASPATTQKYYIRVKRVFGSRLAAMQMQERARQKQLLLELRGLPDQLKGIVQQHVAEIDAKLAEIKDAINPQAMAKLRTILTALEHLGITPPDGSAA